MTEKPWSVAASAFITISRLPSASQMKRGFRWARAESDAATTSAVGSAIRSPMFRACRKGPCWTSPIRRYLLALHYCRFCPAFAPIWRRLGEIQTIETFPSLTLRRISRVQWSLADLPSPSATHVSLGVQREMARDLVVSADFVVRKFSHIGTPPGLLDANHFTSVRGPSAADLFRRRRAAILRLSVRSDRSR